MATNPTGVLLVEVPGLCKGADIDPRAKQVGYLCFIRSTPKGAARGEGDSPEEIAAEMFQTKAHIPLIAASRELFLG